MSHTGHWTVDTQGQSGDSITGDMTNNERILKEDHILEYQEAFNQFDPDNSGLVATKELGNLLRFLGINPTKEELQVVCVIVVDCVMCDGDV